MTYTDMDDMPKEGAASTDTAEPNGTAAPRTAQRPARVRRTKSGPQIYGQDSTGGFDDSQGVIRKDIPGKAQDQESPEIEMNFDPADRTEGQKVQTERQGAVRQQRPQARAASASRPRPQQQSQQQPFVYSQQQPSGQSQQQPFVYSQQRPSVSSQQRPSVQPQQRPSVQSQQRPSVQPQQQPPVQPQQANVRAPKPQGAPKSGKVSRLMDSSRRALRSPLLIIVALFQTIFLVSGLAAIIARQLSYEVFARLISSIPLPSQLSGYLNMFQTLMRHLDTDAVAGALLIRVPDLLLCIGLWMLIVMVRREEERMSGTSFLLMRIYIIVHMVASCIILLAVLVLSVTLVIAAWSSGSGGMVLLSIGVLLGAIIATMIVIMYFFSYLSTVKSIQMNVSAGDFYGKVSLFVGVVHIILALTGIVTLMIGIVNSEATGILSGIGRLGWMILFGVWLFCYRRDMIEYEE